MRKVFIVLLILIVPLLFTNLAFAQDVASESAKDAYQLPYAGLLPDNPLYFIKALRDRIIEFLISDPLKKAEFDLLSADKRLSMGMALFDKREYSLSESTISKGENYMEDGIKKMEQAKGEGRQIDPSFIVNYDLSTKKHKEVINGFIDQSKGDFKKRFERDLQRVLRFINLVSKLKL